jgi:hypothetical protein
MAWDPSVASLLCAAKAARTSSFFPLGHADEVKRAPKLSRYFIEFFRGDFQFAMGFLQAKGGRPWLGAFIFERSTRNVADPQSSHELQTWQSAQLLVVPLSQRGILGVLPHDGILDDGIAEVVDYGGDRENAPESFVERLFCHSCSSMGFGAVDDDLAPLPVAYTLTSQNRFAPSVEVVAMRSRSVACRL